MTNPTNPINPTRAELEAEADRLWMEVNAARAFLHATVAQKRAWNIVDYWLEPALERADEALAAWKRAAAAAEQFEAEPPPPCCAEVGPLLTAPGTSGRSWECDSCGRVWTRGIL